jgi:hypothetical protein
VLKRNAEAEVSEAITEAWGALDKSKSIGMVLYGPSVTRKVGAMMPPQAPGAEALNKLAMVTATLGVDNPWEFSLRVKYDDEASARYFKTMIDVFIASRKAILNMPAEWTATWDTYQSAIEGTTMTASIKADVDVMIANLKGNAPTPAP